MRLKFDRPIAFLDTETTGINTETDRIIDIAVIKVHPDGREEYLYQRLNPGVPIPAEATAIHGIADADVAGKPTFRSLAPSIMEFLRDCDLAGYNVKHYDEPILYAEFKRAGLKFDAPRRLIDPCAIFHKREPRDLAAAMKLYCNEEYAEAHGAKTDARASLKVLQAQLELYPDLPDSVDGLHDYCCEPNAIDARGVFIWGADGEAVCTLKKHKGRRLRELARVDPNYLEWIIRDTFRSDAKAIAREALEGRFPLRPEHPAQH